MYDGSISGYLSENTSEMPASHYLLGGCMRWASASVGTTCIVAHESEPSKGENVTN